MQNTNSKVFPYKGLFMAMRVWWGDLAKPYYFKPLPLLCNPGGQFFICLQSLRFYISLHFPAFICISLHSSEFLCISLKLSAFLYISLHFSAFLYISLHLSAFLYNPPHLFEFLWISYGLHFWYTCLCEFPNKVYQEAKNNMWRDIHPWCSGGRGSSIMRTNGTAHQAHCCFLRLPLQSWGHIFCHLSED